MQTCYFGNFHPSRFLWDIAKILWTCYFGYCGHTWLRTPKVIAISCRKLSCLYGIGDEISITILVFILYYFQEKLIMKFFKKSKKPYFGGYFEPFLPTLRKKSISLGKRALSFFKYSDYLTLCKKSNKTDDQFLRKTSNWLTDSHRNSDFMGHP